MSWPPWVEMWIVAGAIYAACKLLTWLRADVEGVPWWRHAGYLLAWPGLDAGAFLTRTEPRAPTQREWLGALATTCAGAALCVSAATLTFERPDVTGWIGMVGLVLLLHFGLFHLLSCGWRRAGVVARPLMDSPLRAASVAEFWGRRWNTAFRDLTHRFFFQPLVPRLGVAGATLAGFIASGLVHDLVVSVPARGGYGGPTGFFAIQGLALLGERSGIGRRLGLGHDLRGRVFTALVLLLPLPALFHPPFVRRIVVPFLQACCSL